MDDAQTPTNGAATRQGRRRLKIEYVPIAELHPYENNPRDNSAAIEPLAESISQFGFINPVVVTMDGEVLAGHTRIKSATALGEEMVPVIRVDLSPDEARAYRLADNKVAEFSQWEKVQLAQEAALLAGSGIDLADFGFDTSALADLLTPPPDETEEPTAPATIQPRTAAGDLWRLGEHRLLVGDATDPAQVSRLMDGDTADLWLTDPPYNVDYHGSDGATIANDRQGDAAFLGFLVAAFKAAHGVLKPGGSGYVWHADLEGLNFRKAVAEAGFDLAQGLVWVKSALVLGRADYQWRHEPCLYVRKPGAAHYFTEDRTQTTALEDPLPNIETMGAEEMRALLRKIYALKNQTVLRFAKPARNADHPTEKPLGLFMQLVKNSTRRGEIVLDTFAGSGTTLLVCEKAGRRARVMELDPKYATVVLDRWERETGRKAERIGTAEGAT